MRRLPVLTPRSRSLSSPHQLVARRPSASRPVGPGMLECSDDGQEEEDCLVAVRRPFGSGRVLACTASGTTSLSTGRTDCASLDRGLTISGSTVITKTTSTQCRVPNHYGCAGPSGDGQERRVADRGPFLAARCCPSAARAAPPRRRVAGSPAGLLRHASGVTTLPPCRHSTSGR